METKTLSEIFLERLKKHKLDAGHLFYCFFNMMSEETLEEILKESYRDRKTGYWFTAFHKQFRSVDPIDNCFRLDPDPKITPAEEKELEELSTYWDKCSNEIHKFDDKELDALPSKESKNYIKKAAEFKIKREIEWEKKFPLAKKKRMWHLRSLKNDKKKVDISGLLNSAIWTAVWVDKDNVLVEVLEDTFDEFLRQKRKKRVAA